jgi:hypothetical protein
MDMADYQLRAEGGVIRTRDNTAIPENTTSREWRKYLEWVNAGNTVDPAPVVPPVPVADRVETRIASNDALIALVRRIAKKEGITERALLDEIRAEAQEV